MINITDKIYDQEKGYVEVPKVFLNRGRNGYRKNIVAYVLDPEKENSEKELRFWYLCPVMTDNETIEGSDTEKKMDENSSDTTEEES